MYLKYIWYVIRHKWYVFIECCKLGIPILGILHDLSKFLPSEFVPYAKYFYGDYPSRQDLHGDSKYIYPDRLTKEGIKLSFDYAWLHHQKCNKHHWQYWILKEDEGESLCMDMPLKYRKEMLADWIGAGKAITGKNDVKNWYNKNKHIIRLHFLTRDWLENQLAKM